ncbi:MAG TPA: hypothetical protein VFX48_02955, partial [Saprospiraceae bacterium]|nr:hypothetical protein [Saprospiraceae bacterium]
MTRFLHTLLISGMLAFLVFASMGYLAVRLSWQGYVRSAKGMDRDMESHQFFCFSKESSRSLEWVEDDEFILNGSWYDVKHSITHPDGYISLVVYADHWEKYWLDCFFSWDDQ